MAKLIREPQVAGKFYPGTRTELDKLFDRLIDREKDTIRYELSDKQIIGAVLPHAGYIYSGYQTVHFFEILAVSHLKFDSFVIIHPNHRSEEFEYASDECESWRTPLGDIKLDDTFISAMKIPRSARFHEHEHSGEVLVPFIQKFIPYAPKIIPIGIGTQNPHVSKELARKISDAIMETGKSVCILASSDFSHYVNPAYGRKMDQKVIDKILDFNASGVFDEIMKNNISVCGYGPIMTLIEFLRMNYSDYKAEIIARGHSGEIHHSDTVVDYVSILFYLNQ